MAVVKFDRTGLENAITEITKSKNAFQSELNIFQNTTIPQEYNYYSRIKNITQQIEGTLNNINTLIANIQTNISLMTDAENQNESLVDNLPSTIRSTTVTETTTSNNTDTQNNTQINFTSDERQDVFNKIKALVGSGSNDITTSSFATAISNYVKEYCISNYELDSNNAEAIRQHIYNDLTNGEAKEFLDEYLHVNNPDDDLMDWANYIIDLVAEVSQTSQEKINNTSTSDSQSNVQQTITANTTSVNTISNGMSTAKNNLNGKTMDNGSNGCVEAVTKILSYSFEEFGQMTTDRVLLTYDEQADDNSNSDSNTLWGRCKKLGIEMIEFDIDKVEQGDIIFYDEPGRSNISACCCR